jgi:hypothetical protein
MCSYTTKTRGRLAPDLIAGLTTGVANIPDALAITAGSALAIIALAQGAGVSKA